MNLNFYNPNATTLESLQNSLQEQFNKLNELKSIQIGQQSAPKIQQPLQEQRYLVDCGNKEDWNEFLRLNYNLTEREMFDDYKLFLQAKAELSEDNNKEKLEAMKQKIAPRKDVGNVQHTVYTNNNEQQSVQPVHTYQQPVCNEQLVPIQSTNNQLTPQMQQLSGSMQPMQPMQQSQPDITDRRTHNKHYKEKVDVR